MDGGPRRRQPHYLSGARGFLVRFPEPQAPAGLALETRLRIGSHVSPFLNFLIVPRPPPPGLRLLAGTQAARRVARRGPHGNVSPLGPDLARFLAGAEQLGYSARARTGMASEVAARVLIQSGRRLGEIQADDLATFEAAIDEREARNGRDYKAKPAAMEATPKAPTSRGPPASPSSRPTSAAPIIVPACPSGAPLAIAANLSGVTTPTPHPTRTAATTSRAAAGSTTARARPRAHEASPRSSHAQPAPFSRRGRAAHLGLDQSGERGQDRDRSSRHERTEVMGAPTTGRKPTAALSAAAAPARATTGRTTPPR